MWHVLADGTITVQTKTRSILEFEELLRRQTACTFPSRTWSAGRALMALDVNVLVRFFVQDNAGQLATARALIARYVSRG